MGPSVKFVSRINGSFSKKVMGQLFFGKKTKGGIRVGFGKIPHFFRFFFFGTLPLSICYNTSP